jgi:hypothetical protein
VAADTPFSWKRRTNAAGNDSLEVETPFYRSTISPSGVISSLVRKSDSLEFVDPARPWFNALCCQTDQGDLWQYYDGPLYDGGPHAFQYDLIHDPYPLQPQFSRSGRRIVGFAVDNRSVPASTPRVRQAAPHRLTVYARGEFCPRWPWFREFEQFGIRILFESMITFRADIPRIEFRLRTRHEKGQWYRLRAAFFTDIRNGIITHEIPFGRFNRPEGEFAAQNFMVYYDSSKGVALFNRGLPGNNVTDGVMMLSLMRSVSIYARAESNRAFEEGAEHEFEYAILPFGGQRDFSALALARDGLEFAVPPYVFEKELHRLPVSSSVKARDEDSLFQLEPDSICCTAIYPHDDEIVMRLFESKGNATAATLRANFTIARVEETNALLNDRRELEGHSGNVVLSFRPFEIKTLVIKAGVSR